MYKTQGGHRVDMQQLVELRMQPAGLFVEQRGGGVGLGAQHREINLGVRVVRRQLDAGQGDQAGPRYIQLALDEAGQVFLDLVGQPQVAAGDGFGLVTTHERPGNAAPYRERAISLISKTSSWSPTWMSLLPRSVSPQSKPDLTSLTSSLKRRSESRWPVQCTTLLRSRRTCESRRTTPSSTMQPATLPIREMEYTSRTSTRPMTSSFFSGASMPDMAAFTSSTAS